MKIHPGLRCLLLSCPLSLALALTQCEKKEAPSSDAPSMSAPSAGAGGSAPAPVPTAPPKAPSLADHAGKVGFAGNLPVGTELYIGTAKLKQHIDNLTKSAWWKDINALVQDKTPAPTAGDTTVQTFQQLWGDDVFIAGGTGFAQTAIFMRDLNRLYNEVYFKALMTGGAMSLQGESVGANPLIYLQSFLNDPNSLDRLASLLTRLELPPLLIGIKSDKTEDALKFLNNTQQLEEKKIFVMSDLQTPAGHTFRVATIDMTTLLPDATLAPLLAQLPETLPDQTRKSIETALKSLQAKKFKLAWGVVNGHLLLASGMNLDHLNLAPSPAQSLLSKPEFAHLLPYAGKELAGLIYADAASVAAFNDDQPFVPMLRGVVNSMKENETFKEMGGVLDKQLGELSPLEATVYNAGPTSALVAAGWWDKGIHLESFGGITSRFMESGKPLNFSRLFDKAGVVFGIGYHRNEAYGKDFRAWMEKLVSMLYTGAQELVKAGIAGPEGGQQFAQFESTFLPTLLKIYQADKDMDDFGMGSELAFILDVNGKMPEIMFAPPESKGMQIPRITTVGEVKNRAELAKGWTTISESLNGLAKQMGGGNPDPAAAAMFMLPQPISSDKNGVTSYFFGMPFFAGDLLPVASVNDKLLFLSSSKEAAEFYAGELSQPATKIVEGFVWKLDVSALADYASTASKLNPSATPEQTKQLTETLKWVKPLRAMQGHIYEEKGIPRNSLSWEITDVITFD
ncbi:MAG TPA: hypothetical protein VK956_00410 [Verrucomicrobium sp.]|nr:hypothetical protein [Verrucomicrobium sp.]